MAQDIQRTSSEVEKQAGFYEDEIDLRELFLTLWNAKWLIIGITAVFAIGSVVVALALPNIYRAEALLAPAAQEESGGALSGLASQFGGLASLAGISMGSSSVDKTTLAIETMQSRQFLARFIEEHDILVPLFATDKWVLSTNELQLDEDVYDADTGEWLRDVEPPFTPQPSVQEAHEVFRDILSVSQNADSGLVRVAIEHKSPYVAADWVRWLVKDVNRYMRETDIAEARLSIQFLQQQINATSIAEMQQLLFQLIQEQTKTIMLAEVRPEYVLKTIDPAVAPEEEAKPSRALICIFGTMLGGMLACLFVLLRQAFRSDDRVDAEPPVA
jgi:LPS O-antigen subunit length determinant protein (WzzB/FepE family)